jgi:hypothetical protein
MQRTTETATYHARILKLRLPEQDSLKDAAERCSADPVSLASIGRAVGQQVRIKCTDDFVAAYTVNQPNPDDPGLADVVRTGLAGRERLGTGDEMDQATVEATVVDAAPTTGARFFEEAKDTRDQSYFVVIAPHGGLIEQYTDEQATEVLFQLRAAGFPASAWLCKGFGDDNKGASDRWHITSDDINPASFPLLGSLMFATVLLWNFLPWLRATRGRKGHLYRRAGANAAESSGAGGLESPGPPAPGQNQHWRRRTQIPGIAPGERDQSPGRERHSARAVVRRP